MYLLVLNWMTWLWHINHWTLPCTQIFQFGPMTLIYTFSNKYLRFVLNKNMSFSEVKKNWQNNIKLCPDLGSSTFSKLYHLIVYSVLFYLSSCWKKGWPKGYLTGTEHTIIFGQERSLHYFLFLIKATFYFQR